jgi:hypothetical protein
MSEIEKAKAQAWDILSEVVTTYEKNVDDDEGDKFLSSANLAMEVIGDILYGQEEEGIRKAMRDGWISPKCWATNCPVTSHVGAHTPGISWHSNTGQSETCKGA